MLVMLALLLLTTVLVKAQPDKKAAELKKLETNVDMAKARVALNERKLEVSDSLINVGTQQVDESKNETKAIEADRKKLDKDNAARQKSLSKLTTSKDKDEAVQARADLKALNLQYSADSKALSLRSKDATKKMSTGNANLTKGKANKKSAHDALKMAQSALDAAQAKYDAATGSDEKTPSKGKKKK